MKNLNILDPQTSELGYFSFLSFFKNFLNDTRDMVFIKTAFIQFFIIIPMSLFIFFQNPPWWFAVIYWATIIYQLGPFLLMLHLICHRRLFKKKYDWVNKVIPWTLGLFFGQIPEGFFAHHITMHHTENNLKDDLSSTLVYRRDSIKDWLIYFVRFIFLGRLTLVNYLISKKKFKVLNRLLLGILFFYGVMAFVCFLNFKAGFIIFIIPTLIAWFGLMAGNWTQHAFVDHSDPSNPYKNSITVINSIYNKRCFNDGYHIGHHVQAAKHWTEMPEDFIKNKEQYIKNKSIVFKTLDYQIIWFFLMIKNYKFLSKYFVNLDQENPMNEQEIISLLKVRLNTLKVN